MMKAPGSLSFSSAMAVEENGRSQSWHGETPCALQNQQVWVRTGHPGSIASQLGTELLLMPLHIWIGFLCERAARQGLISLSPPLPFHGYLRTPISTQPSSEKPSTGEKAGTLPMKAPCPQLVLPSYFSHVSKTTLSIQHLGALQPKLHRSTAHCGDQCSSTKRKVWGAHIMQACSGVGLQSPTALV